METFYESQHCKSQVHCNSCRDLSDYGKQFRFSLAKTYNLAFDFACPLGKPWITMKYEPCPKCKKAKEEFKNKVI